MKQFFVFIFSFSFLPGHGQQYRKDFDFLWTTIKRDYAYWNKKATNWEKVNVYYGPRFDTIASKGSFVLLLEKAFNELYDHHASLGTNTQFSQRLVPSGTDIWAQYVGGRPIISEVRLGFGPANVGLRAGMEILSVNDVNVEKGIHSILQFHSITETRKQKTMLCITSSLDFSGLTENS